MPAGSSDWPCTSSTRGVILTPQLVREVDTPILDSPDTWTPCRDGNNGLEPDDWFIAHNEVATKLDTDRQSKTYGQDVPDVEATQNLRKRRRAAKQACWDCPLGARLECLQLGMTDDGLRFGIWGGYDVPERTGFRRAADARRRAGVES